MNLLYLIFPLALLIAAGFVVAFVWSARRGQFDDLDTPAMRMLFDDEDEEGGDAGAGGVRVSEEGGEGRTSGGAGKATRAESGQENAARNRPRG